MSWETRLYTSIHYNRKTYETLGQVQSDIQDCEDGIARCKKRLMELAIITEPAKFAGEDADPLTWMENEVEEQVELLTEYQTELTDLYKLEEAWDRCHTSDGEPIHEPEDMAWNTAYINGDFILTKAEKEQGIL